MKNKKDWGIVLLVLLILVTVFIFLFYLQNRGREEVSGLQIIRGDLLIEPVTGDFANMPQTNISMDNGDQFQGYLVSDILRYFELEREEIKAVYFSARDGGRIIVSRDEIEKREVLLAIDNNTFRLIFPQDGFRNRWLKNIIALEID